MGEGGKGERGVVRHRVARCRGSQPGRRGGGAAPAPCRCHLQGAVGGQPETRMLPSGTSREKVAIVVDDMVDTLLTLKMAAETFGFETAGPSLCLPCGCAWDFEWRGPGEYRKCTH